VSGRSKKSQKQEQKRRIIVALLRLMIENNMHQVCLPGTSIQQNPVWYSSLARNHFYLIDTTTSVLTRINLCGIYYGDAARLLVNRVKLEDAMSALVSLRIGE
jgi:hypothetical protein